MCHGQTCTKASIDRFLQENSRRMAELYGEEVADPKMWGAGLAARLILAYIDRARRDKFWYKRAATIRQVEEPSERKRIVCSCHTGFLSHTGRALLVAQRLRELGHKVIFAVDTETRPDESDQPTRRRYAALIEQAGFEMYHTPFLLDEVLSVESNRSTGGTMGHYNVRMVEEETDGLLHILREMEKAGRRPDFMLVDSAWTASIAGDVMNIPVGSLWNFQFTNYNRSNPSLPEEHPIRKVMHKLGGNTMVELFERSRIALAIMAVLLFVWVTPYNIVRIKHMVKEKKWIGLKRNVFAQLSGELNLFPDYVAFGGVKITHKALPVGPIVWEPESIAIDCPLVQSFRRFLALDQDKALIYVTMGSSGQLQLFRLIIDALKDKNYRLVMTTGAQFDLSELGEMPENILVIPLYPGKEICERASLVINHGGSGSVNQAIQNRVPQLCIPTFVDQQWISDLAARRGLAKQLLAGRVTAESLNVAIDELLGDDALCHNRR